MFPFFIDVIQETLTFKSGRKLMDFVCNFYSRVGRFSDPKNDLSETIIQTIMSSCLREISTLFNFKKPYTLVCTKPAILCFSNTQSMDIVIMALIFCYIYQYSSLFLKTCMMTFMHFLLFKVLLSTSFFSVYIMSLTDKRKSIQLFN